VGLILVIFSPDFDFTNSLLINRPIGCLYLLPFGAVRSMNKSAIPLVAEYARLNCQFLETILNVKLDVKLEVSTICLAALVTANMNVDKRGAGRQI